MRLILFLMGLLNIACSYGQSNFFFRHSFDTVPYSWGVDVRYANGKIYEYGSNEKPGWSTTEIHLGIFNDIGELERLSKFDTTRDSTYYTSSALPRSIFVGSDSSVYVVGSQLVAQKNTDGEIFKWSVSGDLIVNKSIQGDSAVLLFNIVESGGYLYAYGGIADSFIGEKSASLLIKLDTGLNVIWSRTYEWDDIELSRGMFATADSGVIFASTSGKYLDWYGRVVQVDRNGDLVSDRSLPIGRGECYLLDYNPTDGSMLIMRYVNTPNPNSNLDDIWHLYIHKLDSSLNQTWTKYWIADGSFPSGRIYNNLRNALRLDDFYVLCGDNAVGGWVICLAEDGSKLWEAEYMNLQGVALGIYPTFYYMTGIDTLPQNRGYVLSGSTSDTLDRQVAFIMSIDKNGCFSDDTCEAKQYVSITYYESAIKVQVFPNPIQDYVSIKVTNTQLNGAELIVTDLLGRTVAKQTLLQELTTFSTQDWANGMYVWSLVEDVRLVRSGKLVKE
jgi:hypothetical protein